MASVTEDLFFRFVAMRDPQRTARPRLVRAFAYDPMENTALHSWLCSVTGDHGRLRATADAFIASNDRWMPSLDHAQMVPFCVIPFDGLGTCTAPRTRQQLLKQAAAGKFPHVVISVHGWNNDSKGVSQRYEAEPPGWTSSCRIAPGLTGRPGSKAVIEHRPAIRRPEPAVPTWVQEPRVRDVVRTRDTSRLVAANASRETQ